MNYVKQQQHLFPSTDPTPALFWRPYAWYSSNKLLQGSYKQLKSRRCASVYMLRTACIAESCGQTTSNSRILSRYSSWIPHQMDTNGSAHSQLKCTFQD